MWGRENFRGEQCAALNEKKYRHRSIISDKERKRYTPCDVDILISGSSTLVVLRKGVGTPKRLNKEPKKRPWM